jgi:hypothetical protein
METESNKGNTVIIHNGFKYRKYYTTKAGVDCWRCTQKSCNARILTVCDETTHKPDILSQKNEHVHGEKVINVAAVTHTGKHLHYYQQCRTRNKQ